MIDTIKKTVLAGVGAAVATAEKVQEGLDGLVKDGRISAEEARSVAERIAREGKKEYERASATLGGRFRDALSHVDAAVNHRLSQLEARVAHLETPAPARAKPAKRRVKRQAAGRRK
ncbi:MAG TPA: hypothetical protein VGG34_09065 [Opitutaceae bacterium]|jgi:polyhydroxyalkanoate synthesis regulator phasin